MAKEVALPFVDVLGVRVHTLSLEDVIGHILRTVDEGNRAIVAYANVHAINLAFGHAEFRGFLNSADVVFCDGQGLRLGARLAGLRIPNRFTPPDWIHQLASECAKRGFSIYLLGARPGVATQAARRLERDVPGLRICGTHHGYFDKAPGHVENEQVIEAINAARPSILVVGFGMPLQELWLNRNWRRLNANVALPAGALLDYLAGGVPRAPRWLTDRGFEWLARLLIEPRRLWSRYLIGNPLFLGRVLLNRLGLLRVPPID